MFLLNHKLEFFICFVLLFVGNIVGYSFEIDVNAINLFVAVSCFLLFVPTVMLSRLLALDLLFVTGILCYFGIKAMYFASFGLFALVGANVWLCKDYSRKNLSLMLILVAVFFNLSFISNTWFNWVQYDILSCYNYIEYIIDNNFMFWKENPLLSRPSYSAYHPILHFFVAGVFMKLAEVISGSLDVAKEVVQVVFCFYMFVYYIFANKIIEFFKFDKMAHLVALGFVCFFPIFNAMAGYFNNDGLLLALQCMSVYYALIYYRDDSKKDLWLMVLCVVLACLTKLSGVVVLPMIGVIFLIKLWNKRGLKCFYELLMAGTVILLGVALWPMYQYFVLGVDYNFVPPQKHLSLVEYSYWERFNPIKAFIYEKMFYDDFGINLWETMTKTAIFGQWNFSVKADDVFGLVIVVNYCYKALLGIIIGGIGYILIKKRCAEWWLVLVLMLGTLVAHVIFGIMHPYMCNMDFRYVAILNLPMALILGVVMQNISKVWRYIIASVVGVLAVSSTIIWWWVVL